MINYLVSLNENIKERLLEAIGINNNDNSNNMVIGFVSIDGDKILLDENWSMVDNINSLSVERGQKSLTFKTNFSNQTITKKYTFLFSHMHVILNK